MPKHLSVVIPTFNRKDILKRTLQSFSEQSSRDFEVIVADDGSTDGTAEMVRSLNVPFQIKHVWQVNSGRSAARNMGISAASGGIVLFADDHMVADRRLVEEHIKTHNALAGTAFKVVRGRAEFCERAEDAPKATRYIEEGKFRAPLNEQDPFRQFITNNISVDKQALISAGGFDEDFKEYGLQDSECGLRLRRAGYKFKINPNAVLYIFGVGLTIEDRKRRRRQLGRSSVLFYKKHPSFFIKMSLSVHWVPRLLRYLLSLGGEFIPKRAEGLLASRPSPSAQKLIVFYSFLCGIEDGFEKYKDVKHLKLKSRFSGKRKILFLSHNARLEGAPISLLELAKNLPKEKYEMIFVLPQSGPIKAMLDEAKIRTEVLGGIGAFRRWRLQRVIEQEGIDVVHVNTVAGGWGIEASKKSGAKVVWHVREDMRYMRGAPVRKYLDKADIVIAISNWVKRSLGFDSEKVRVVWNAVDLRAFSQNVSGREIRREFGLGDDEVLVGQVGAISERKGADIFALAAKMVAARVPNVRFMLVGDFIPGEFFRGKFQTIVRELKLGERLILVPPRKEIRDVIAAMNLVVNSSRSEPFGRTIIEAMAMGKAVIGADVGGIPEIIVDGKTGVVVKGGDPDALASAISSLAKDPLRRNEMGRSGRRRAEELFGMEKHVKEIDNIYEEVLR